MKMVVKITNVQTKFICVETDTIEEGQEMGEEMVASDEFEFSNENITYEIRDVISSFRETTLATLSMMGHFMWKPTDHVV